MKDTEKYRVTGQRLNVCQAIKGRGGRKGWKSPVRPPEADGMSLSPEAGTGHEGHPGQEPVGLGLGKTPEESGSISNVHDFPVTVFLCLKLERFCML